LTEVKRARHGSPHPPALLGQTTLDPLPLAEVALTFAASAAVGLLVGLERERNPSAKAGLRTFALIAVLGTLTAMLAQAVGSGWVLALGLAVVGASLAGAYLVDPRTAAGDAGMTTVIAAMVVFCLGAINFHGYRVLAVAIGITMTALLHFKIELEGAARRLTPRDIRSMLQFGAVTAVILPLLPDRAYGPYGSLNPFHIWLMVVLISGVSLAGYVAWRLTRDGRGVILTGLLGGLVSSTATSVVYARHAQRATLPAPDCVVVIALANCAMLARVLLIVLIVAPRVAAPAAIALLPALLFAVWPVVEGWSKSDHRLDSAAQDYRNPANLLTSVLFGAGYALMLVVSAWLSDTLGTRGVYGFAVVSGLTDVDAITLSSLRLFNVGTLATNAAATAIVLGVGANLVMKATLVATLGGASLRRAGPQALLLPAVGLVLGWLALRALD
jgi:uncharacterized membrane protein (DUF4010 family)